MAGYIPTIGIEAHVQLKTKTKLFAAIDNDAREAKPNTLISHICVGMPGALPVLNQKAVELGVRAGLALNGDVQKFSKFDRKHYFYPDLPKGYQITQYDEPIIKSGYVDVEVDGTNTKVGIVRVHLEEDAGKTTHPAGADYSLVDLNRAGTPLLEIVSQPDMHSAAEAKAYARELYLIMKYADVSDCDLYHGHMRFDVNVSVSRDPAKPGIRTETKNLNSFRSVENAVTYEIKRQTELLKKGNKIAQETLGWDEAKQKTTSQRGKEEAEDYRYMPEPDVPPIELSETDIADFQKDMPLLPFQYRSKFKKIEINDEATEDILNIPSTAELVNRILDQAGAEHARRVAFWMMQIAQADKVIEQASTNQVPISDTNFIKLSELVASSKLSSSGAKEVLVQMLKDSKDPEEIAKSHNLLQVSDAAELEKIVTEVIKENSKAAEDVKSGQQRAIGFLVGQVMAKSKGQANPELAQKILKKQLDA